eukprot:CAMPEP_0197827794 /NCGR_PEP_ID=MMETSP1437-20131217/4502_1 /TAXON_ID=49252 ORGANISM="Eucampia antarctica, Strain CCMP1452" /NCGR_SAMPLE_ID=MMETSP1437 /ASSEMBLY_ACC=CAM_ASM_001096 /LENGTH=267 /DNA_ID=CAMNT_0043428781 /DNA_START=101 /DNA_END=901 /DNA_ORIENTATION=+
MDNSCNGGNNSYDGIFGLSVCGFNGHGSNGPGHGVIFSNSCNQNRNSTNLACNSNGRGDSYKAGPGSGVIMGNSCNNANGNVCNSNGRAYGNFLGNGVIKSNSCNNGGEGVLGVCNNNGFSNFLIRDSYGVIGSSSCNFGSQKTCSQNGVAGNAIIGDNSCNIKNNTALSSCYKNGEYIARLVTIGNNACNAPDACNRNRGNILDNCCNYPGACNKNLGNITIGTAACDGFTVIPTLSPSSNPTSSISSITEISTIFFILLGVFGSN